MSLHIYDKSLNEKLPLRVEKDAELIKDEERKEFRLHYRFKRENLNAGL